MATPQKKSREDPSWLPPLRLSSEVESKAFPIADAQRTMGNRFPNSSEIPSSSRSPWEMSKRDKDHIGNHLHINEILST